MKVSAHSPISTPTAVPVISSSPRRPWQRRRLWAAAAAGLVLVAGIGLVQRQSGTSRANLEPYTVVAAAGDLPGVVSASGELEAEKRVNVSPKR